MTIKAKTDYLLAFMNTPEGEASINEYFDEIKRKEATQDLQIDRWWVKYGNDQDMIIEKIKAKYESEQYRDRWYNRGIEPPESLYSLLFAVARKYGRQWTPQEYADNNNCFYCEGFRMAGWDFELVVGQGAYISVRRAKF